MLPAVRVLHDDVGSDDVRRHQVGRELDAREGELEPFREGLDEERLAEARHPLEEHVAARKHADQDVRNDFVMSDNDLLDFRAQGLEGGDKRLTSRVAIHPALLSRILPTTASPELPAIIESRQAPGAATHELPLAFILLDDHSKLPANCGGEPTRQLAAKSTTRRPAVTPESAPVPGLLNFRARDDALRTADRGARSPIRRQVTPEPRPAADRRHSSRRSRAPGNSAGPRARGRLGRVAPGAPDRGRARLLAARTRPRRRRESPPRRRRRANDCPPGPTPGLPDRSRTPRPP